jgi:hypothetical protein
MTISFVVDGWADGMRLIVAGAQIAVDMRKRATVP